MPGLLVDYYCPKCGYKITDVTYPLVKVIECHDCKSLFRVRDEEKDPYKCPECGEEHTDVWVVENCPKCGTKMDRIEGLWD